ncbi:hypothetical protein BYT27DRAFT_7264248 [Phlegmacium glaucopus]|nr:hypothetical protein BYT27DRAFT_7264248 [Phlegmacium glaucopus]
MQDPITQVFAGLEIDLNQFCNTTGLDIVDRALNMAGDPYTSTKFFHFMIDTILEVLMGVSKRWNGTIVRKEGILGIVKSYVGTVEAQGRGSLHLHLLLWLEGAPTAKELKQALGKDIFHEKVKHYISKTIRADLDGKEAGEVMAMKKVDAVSYSRPLDPRNPADVRGMKTAELEIARMTQLHKCSYANCLKMVKGQAVCKRRAPFPLAPDDWVDSVGRWGPKQLCGYLNNWNPSLLMSVRSNHDISCVEHASKLTDIASSQSVAFEQADTHIITMVEGVIALKDQLHEYMFQGEEMVEMNFFTFILDTYDTKSDHSERDLEDEHGKSGIERRGFGRPQNRRVAYQEGFNRSGQTRVFRTEGHETLPQFVGSWMPRNDRPGDREIYCGSMLALLKPWTDLSDLKTDMETFEQSFHQFVSSTTKRNQDILENIQYYYECYDGAKK